MGGERHHVRPVGAGQRRSRRRAVRPGPARRGPRPYRLDELEVGERTRYERAFNWKVLLENYCENYHTPFVHSQLPVQGYEYPIECAGPVVFAWTGRWPRVTASERALHDHRPGEAGWAAVADVAAERLVQQRDLPRPVPQHRHLVLRRLRRHVPPAAHVRRPRSSSASTYWHPSVPAERRAADLAATREVVEQDLGMCEALQRTYDAGLSADGVLSTEHEAGVGHVHDCLPRALAGR